MNTELYTLFPTPVIRIGDFLSAEECCTLFEYLCKLDTAQQHSAILDNGTSSHDFVSNIVPELDTVVEQFSVRVQRALDEFTTVYGQRTAHTTNSWYSIQNQGSILKDHIHSNSHVSAVVYVRVDDESSRLYFDNPNPFVSYTNQTNVVNEFNFEYYYFEPKLGDIIVFPSWLKHGSHYDKNNTHQRTIISINAHYD